jgi:hypothetical protein
MPTKRATVYEVADRAGVCPRTVSLPTLIPREPSGSTRTRRVS